MGKENSMMLLVGDNPFHGISHLSQERSRSRGDDINHAQYAAELVKISLDNGANGFMFSVSEMTLSILEMLRQENQNTAVTLNAIVPYAYEYVRLATQTGGVSGLAKKIGKKILLSANVKAMALGVKGFVQMDLESLLKTYVIYEISRIRSAAGKKANIDSLLLHEIVTEMALALNLDWLFKSYIEFMSRLGIKPGFETRNFAYLVRKFKDWSIDFHDLTIAAPFNKVGFQMTPSRTECEKALADLPTPSVVAMSILAAGYIKPMEAVDYVLTLPNLKGVAVGVSKERHARETFRLIRQRLEQS